MSDRSDHGSDDDFRRAMADVRPIAPRARRRVALRRPAPPPVAKQRRRDERAVLGESISGPVSLDHLLDSGEELSFLRHGLSRDVLRKLRRGHWVIESDLDLHGMNRPQAAEQLALFLRGCSAQRMRCVRIVHGKGLGSRNREPVLKHYLHKLLPRRDDVLAFCQAPAAHGGAGALLILLRKRL
ncbi:MAG: Smr/MutS family protein [bacterium]|jgi:DNA-nicking Smr family endonuclease